MKLTDISTFFSQEEQKKAKKTGRSASFRKKYAPLYQMWDYYWEEINCLVNCLEHQYVR